MEDCPVCGGAAERVSEVREITVGQRTVAVEDHSFACAECGERFYAPGMMDETLRRAADVIRQRDGLLTPAEIRRVRTGLGYTQSEFESILGAGPKTVTRWERGTVAPTGPTDTLLRIFRRHHEIAHEIAVERGVRRPAGARPAGMLPDRSEEETNPSAPREARPRRPRA